MWCRNWSHHFFSFFPMQVVLKINLWKDAGLTNGATGTVIDMVYKPGVVPPNLPEFILVQV